MDSLLKVIVLIKNIVVNGCSNNGFHEQYRAQTFFHGPTANGSSGHCYNLIRQPLGSVRWYCKETNMFYLNSKTCSLQNNSIEKYVENICQV